MYIARFILTKSDIEKIKEMNPKGIILTGGPNSCYEADSPTYTRELFELGDSGAGSVLWRAADDACAGRKGKRQLSASMGKRKC